MPAATSYNVRKAQLSQGPRWAMSYKERDSYEKDSDCDLDAAGGVA
jgi:hypothetical protein